MKPVAYFFVLVFFLSACTKDDVEVDYFFPNENEFIFLVSDPTSGDEVKIVTYDCAYNELVEVVHNHPVISIKKEFNGAMKQPCLLEYDTISLGNLSAGTYNVTLTINDISTQILTDDSSYSIYTETLIVKD